jgi:hypothetical protein
VTPVAAAPGSRRRRLWELDGHAQCPVVGLCLPVAVLRRLMQRHASGVGGEGGEGGDDDYALHVEAVAASKQRSELSQALQRELDQRHALLLQAAARLKCPEALLAWWQAQRQGPQVAGALWALLTHPRCTPAVERSVLGDVHMQQHELAQHLAELARREQQAQAEQARLARDNAALAARVEEALRLAARQREDAQVQLVRLRGVVLAREARAADLQAQLDELRASVPELAPRQALAQQLQHQQQRSSELQRQLSQAQDEIRRLREAATVVPLPLPRDEVAAAAAAADTEPPAAVAVWLHDRAVLCVGGRTRAVPQYRQLVEDAGGRFLHHDGGDEDGARRLEATLAAADLVICQAGCISHGAYWRVKDYCKRTGKPCVFLEQPSASGLQRALAQASLDLEASA